MQRYILPALALALLWGHQMRAQEFPPDMVVLSGRELPALALASADTIVVVAVHDGATLPVHVQIDQRDGRADGSWRYAFEAGEEPRAAQHTGFGPDDLLLLALSEGGARMHQPLPGYTEIEATDSSGGSVWFYIGRGTPLPVTPLIRYDSATDRVAGIDYAIAFARNGTAVIDSLVIGDPERDPNLLDRNKARLDIDLAMGIGTVHRTEDDVRVRTTGLHIGPLRIVRECEVRGRMLLGIYSAAVRDNFTFYPHGFIVPTTIRLTPGVRLLVHRVTLRISMDLVASAEDLTFQSSPDVPEPIRIDGHGGRRGTQHPIDWYLLRRGDVNLLGWLWARADIARDVTLYYRDDVAHADPPEATPGERGDHGFLFHHAGPLPAGDIRLSSYAWLFHGDTRQQPTAALEAFKHQPRVQVH